MKLFVKNPKLLFPGKIKQLHLERRKEQRLLSTIYFFISSYKSTQYNNYYTTLFCNIGYNSINFNFHIFLIIGRNNDGRSISFASGLKMSINSLYFFRTTANNVTINLFTFYIIILNHFHTHFISLTFILSFYIDC